MNSLRLVALLLFLLTGSALSQAPDTVMVPTSINGVELGAINLFIEGDTTASGARANPARVYMLQKGTTYYASEFITVRGYHLNLIGETPEGAEPPAIVAPGVLDDGNIPTRYFMVRGDLTTRNIYFLGGATNGKQINGVYTVAGDGARVEVNNCIFDQIGSVVMNLQGKLTKAFVTDNVFLNLQRTKSAIDGKAVQQRTTPADSVVIINNSMINSGGYLFHGWNSGTNYLRLDHNTIVNNATAPVSISQQTNATVSDNLFVDAHFLGESSEERASKINDSDGLVASLINVDTLATSNEFPEVQRQIRVRNNAWLWSGPISGAWAADDSLEAIAWMNSRTAAMFADDDGWPGLMESGNVNVAPTFTRATNNDELVLGYALDLRAQRNIGFWGWDLDGDPAGVQWPLEFDLSYADEDLMTSGTGGFPVGDLNWFPEQRAAWEAAGGFSVDAEPTELPVSDGFGIRSVFPNPASRTVTVAYNLDAQAAVSLELIDVLGRRVLLADDLPAHPGEGLSTRIEVPERVASGTYLLSLTAIDQTRTRVVTGKLVVIR